MAGRKAILVKVIGGRDLVAKDKTGKSDPYCYVNVVENGEHLKGTRVRTKTIFKNLNPMWNEQFEFADVDIENSELFVELWDQDRVGSDDYMGHIMVPLGPLLTRRDTRMLDWFELSTRKNSKGKMCKVSGAVRLQLVVNERAQTFGALNTAGEQAAPAIAQRAADVQYSDSVPQEVLDGLEKEELRRQQVIFELVNTEAAYLDDLVLIQNHFVREAEETKIITADELASIVSNLSQIITLSKIMLHSMKALQEDSPVVTKVGSVFIENKEALQHLITYCSHQSLVTEKLEALYATNSPFMTFVQSLQANPEFRQLPLDSYLVKPLQRMCKYPLLLRELLSKTPEGHEDREDLEKADAIIKQLVAEANEQTRHVELCHKMAKFAQMLAGTKYEAVFQNNKLELDTEVEVMQESKSQPAIAILLANTLLVGKGRKGVSLQIILAYNLCGLTVKKLGGAVLGMDDGIDKFFLQFSSTEEQEKWAVRIAQLQDSLFKQRQAAKAEADGDAEGDSEAADFTRELEASLKFSRAQNAELVRQLQKVSAWQLKSYAASRPAPAPAAQTPAGGRCLLVVSGVHYSGKTTLARALLTKLTLMERNCAVVQVEHFMDKLQCHLRGQTDVLSLAAAKLVAKVVEGLVENDGAGKLHLVMVEGAVPNKETTAVYREAAAALGMVPVFACCAAPCSVLEQRKKDVGGGAAVALSTHSFVPEGAVIVDTAEPLRSCVSVVLDTLRQSMTSA